MTARVWPVDAVTGAPSYTGRSLRQTQMAPLLGGASAARPLGAFSGVRPGTANNIVTATSTTWTVTPFAGVIDGEALAIAGPYGYAFDANVTGSVTAAAGSARIDRLDVQVSDPAESDGSSVPSIAIIYTAGTPGSGVPPTQAVRSHQLALINVPLSGGGSPTVTWFATYCVGAGGVLPVLTFALLPASATLGQRAEVFADGTSANNTIYRWNGSAWLPVDVVCALRKSTDQNLTTSAAAIIWDVEIGDPAGMHDNVTNNTRITFPIAGLYEVSVQVYNSNATGFGTISGRVNGATAVAGSSTRRTSDTNTGTPMTSVFPVVAAAADYLEIMAFHSTGSGAIISSAAALASVVTVKRIGPA